MRPHAIILTLLVALVLSACATPSIPCDPCGTADLIAPETGPTAASQADGGDQIASNEPYIRDTVRVQPATTVIRGDGDATTDVWTDEVRSLSGAPAINQMLIQIPTAQVAPGGSPVETPEVSEHRAYLSDLRQQRADVYSRADMTAQDRATELASIDLLIRDTLASLAMASRPAYIGPSSIVYRITNPRTAFISVSGTSSGEAGKGSIAPKAQEMMAEKGAAMIEAVMEAREELYEDAAPEGDYPPDAPGGSE